MLLAQHLAEDPRRLLDDGGEGDGVDDPAMALFSMVEREAEGGKRLATSRRHREGEQARRQRRLAANVSKNIAAQRIDGAALGTARHVVLKPC